MKVLMACDRMGYDFAFLTRRDLLRILYGHIKDKSTVHTSKRVCDIQQDANGVTVTCLDGSKYVSPSLPLVGSFLQDCLEQNSTQTWYIRKMN